MTALLAAWIWLRGNLAVVPAMLLAVAIAYPIGLSVGHGRERAASKAALVTVEAQAARLQRAADALLQQRRTASNAAIGKDRKEVDDALSRIPDQAPSARQRARACVELQRQADAARFSQPAC